MSGSGPVRVFLSYAHEDHKWRDDLLNQLGGLRHDDKLVHFDDRRIAPGEEWDARIKAELAAADIVVLLLSPPFVGSGYCHRVELRGAIARAEAGQAHLVPIVCDHIDLKALPIASRQCLPPDEQGDLKPLKDWPNPNVPLARIAARIRELVGAIGATRASVIGGTGIWRRPPHRRAASGGRGDRAAGPGARRRAGLRGGGLRRAGDGQDDGHA